MEFGILYNINPIVLFWEKQKVYQHKSNKPKADEKWLETDKGKEKDANLPNLNMT